MVSQTDHSPQHHAATVQWEKQLAENSNTLTKALIGERQGASRHAKEKHQTQLGKRKASGEKEHIS